MDIYPTDEQMFTARDFPSVHGRLVCDGCPKPAEVHIIAVRGSDGDCKTVNVCKDHMLDPGPLLDW
jgi:hypothetical protein